MVPAKEVPVGSNKYSFKCVICWYLLFWIWHNTICHWPHFLLFIFVLNLYKYSTVYSSALIDFDLSCRSHAFMNITKCVNALRNVSALRGCRRLYTSLRVSIPISDSMFPTVSKQLHPFQREKDGVIESLEEEHNSMLHWRWRSQWSPCCRLYGPLVMMQKNSNECNRHEDEG